MMKTTLKLVSLGVTISTGCIAAPTFQKLGDLPGGSIYSDAVAVSSDGTVVAGNSSGEEGWVAFRWTASEGMVSIGDLPGGKVGSTAFDISPDGDAIAGWSYSTSDNREAFLWVKNVGIQGLGDLPGGTFFSNGRGVTNGGTMVIGSASNTMGWEAMRWTPGTGIVGLGDMGGDYNTTALATSPNCDYYVGMGTTSNGTEAYLATVGGYKQPLGDLPGGTFSSSAWGVSSGGTYVVGSGSAMDGSLGFIWSSPNGMQALPDLPGGNVMAGAYGVSDDGKVIVGMSNGSDGYTAVMWDADRKIIDLNTFLADNGIDPGDFRLESAAAVTPDGLTIVGTGTNAAYESQAWILHLDKQADPFDLVWGDSAEHGDGWRFSAWFDWFNASWYPLMWHTEHGWMQCNADNPDSVMLYDHGLGSWIWTSRAVYPFVYMYGGDASWLFYIKGCEPGHRWFFHYNLNTYVNEENM